MRFKAVAAETMEVGKKGGGKHWTSSEVAARQAAADELERKDPIILEPPEWLSPSALAIWLQVIDRAKGVNLLDNLDTETLATYCDAVIQYQRLSKLKKKTIDHIKLQQSWARIISTLGDKLGLNPSARARLIKKKAEKKLDQFGNQFD